MTAIYTARNVLNGRSNLCWIGRIFRVYLMVATCLVLGAIGRLTAGAQVAGEYQLKAIFLQNFARFVDWPVDTFPDSRDPFVICVLGRDPFQGELEMAVKGRNVNNRNFVIRRPAKVQDARGCEIAFVSDSEKRHLESILSSLSFLGVLTVGDTEGFIQSGGIINFVLEEGRVRCEINAEAAGAAHLKISSKLLGVARIITVPGRGPE